MLPVSPVPSPSAVRPLGVVAAVLLAHAVLLAALSQSGGQPLPASATPLEPQVRVSLRAEAAPSPSSAPAHTPQPPSPAAPAPAVAAPRAPAPTPAPAPPPPINPVAALPGAPATLNSAPEAPAWAPNAPSLTPALHAAAAAHAPSHTGATGAAASPGAPSHAHSASTAAPAASAALVPPSSSAAHLHNPPPPYPALSRRLGEQGRVVLRVRIEADGLPSAVELYASSGHTRLDQAALQAVARWRFVPGTRNGVPEAMWFHVPLHFVLE